MKKVIIPIALLLLTACGQKDQNAQDVSQTQAAEDAQKKEESKAIYAQMEFPDGMIYDFGLSGLVVLYVKRLHPLFSKWMQK